MFKFSKRISTNGLKFHTNICILNALKKEQKANGAIAQLVECLNGIQKVSGSTPLSSTSKQ